MSYHFESTINPLDGTHFENLNLDGLVDDDVAESLPIDNNNHEKIDGQHDGSANVQREFSQEPAFADDYDQDNETKITYQSPFQQQYESDFEPEHHQQVNHQYTGYKQGKVTDHVETPFRCAGRNMVGNDHFANHYNQQLSHQGLELVGNGQFHGNNGNHHVAPRRHLQNHRQLVWVTHAAVGQYALNAPAAPQFHAVYNLENEDPAQVGVIHQQFYMPQYQIGLNYEQRFPQTRVQEDQDRIAHEIAAANETLNKKIAYIDTKDLAKRMKLWLAKYNVTQKQFSQAILGTDQAYLSDLIRENPKKFENMRKKKDVYIRMYNFLECSEQEQFGFLQLQIFPPKEKKPADYEKKKRTTIYDEQKEVLREYLKKYPKTSKEQQEEIARRVGLSWTNVYNFFRNEKKT